VLLEAVTHDAYDVATVVTGRDPTPRGPYAVPVPTSIVLLRGVNIGPRNRVSMPELREVLDGAGFDDVRTYVQSGNVVLTSRMSAKRVARECERLIAERFGLDIAVVARTRAELADVVARNPLADVADNPKRYQVTFLDAKLSPAVVRKLEDAVVPPEQFVLHGREVYAWHPSGAARSKLWATLAGRGLGVTATARNWTTVTKLLELASR
jgi:uncharacterized protein (DUF1697 family)